MNHISLSILGMFMFGIELIISKIAIGHIRAESVALIRCIFASVSIGVFMAFVKIPVVKSRFSGFAGVAGVFLGVAFIFFFTALSRGPVSIVAPIAGLCCLIPTIFGVVVLREALTASRAMGIALASVAIILLSS